MEPPHFCGRALCRYSKQQLPDSTAPRGLPCSVCCLRTLPHITPWRITSRSTSPVLTYRCPFLGALSITFTTYVMTRLSLASLKLVDPDTRAVSYATLQCINLNMSNLPSLAECLTCTCAVKGGVFGPIGISARGARRRPFMVPATEHQGTSDTANCCCIVSKQNSPSTPIIVGDPKPPLTCSAATVGVR